MVLSSSVSLMVSGWENLRKYLKETGKLGKMKKVVKIWEKMMVGALFRRKLGNLDEPLICMSSKITYVRIDVRARKLEI